MLNNENTTSLISIILPVFNADKTIAKCIESILFQTFSVFELLIINDGSTDSTLNICERFAVEDSRIKLINQKNKGVSSARNKGIDLSTGKYICFIDSDDWVESEYLAAFFQGEEIDTKEIVFQDCIEVSNNQSTIKYDFENKRYTQSDFRHCIYEQKLLNYGYPFCKLYIKEIINTNNIRFNEEIHFVEDRIFLLEYLQYINYFRFTSKAHYHYTFSDGQQSLTFRHNSYESEINAYYIEKGLLNKLSKQYSFYQNTIAYCQACNGFILYRALRTIYRPEWRKSLKERLAILRKQHTRDNIICLTEYSKRYLGELLNRIAVLLYVSNYLYIYDIYIRFFIFVRYNLSFVWKIFRKVIKPIKDAK